MSNVEVLKVTTSGDGSRWYRVVVLVDGAAVTHRTDQRGRKWKCEACGIERHADCLHVAIAAEAARAALA